MSEKSTEWRENGVRIVHGSQPAGTKEMWPGVQLSAAINTATSHAKKIWAGMIHIEPDARTGPHHHGELESIIYVVSGKAGMRWGDRLEFYAEAEPGDFIFVPPFVPHQEINANPDQPLVCVLVRSDQQPVVVNLDITPAATPEKVSWVDPHHPAG